jgi:fructose-1,6-bisphosphatase/inositol monophosphatase family enzyme
MFFSTANLHRVGALLASAAQNEIMPRFHNLSSRDVQEKLSASDVVTAADEVAEAVIAEGLRAAFPHGLIIGEEAAGRDPGLLGSLGSAELAFLVDPLDGTDVLPPDPSYRRPDLCAGRGELAGCAWGAF